MAQLVILGHKTRSKEVIEILEMLGGKNSMKLLGSASSCGYYIDSNGNICYKNCSYFDDAIQFTLEEFLETFPYKVGDKVLRKPYVGARRICEMKWDSNYNYIKYGIGVGEWFNVSQIQLYEEETMEENTDVALAPDLKGEDYSDRRFGYKIPKGYEFECVRNNEIILKPIKPQYPKTYEECCKILNIPSNGNIAYVGDWVYGGEYLEKHLDRLRKFQQLLICRDAYWKLAGDEMGLDKLWKPYNGQESCKKHVIQTVYNNITCLDTWCQTRNILEFPTEEMRNAFYENFEELIESCKELL